MKKTLLIITALMLVVGCSKEPEKEPINYETTLIERDGVHYTKDTNKPYSGPVFSLYENGQKMSEGTMKDGKPDGLLTSWYENGKKELEATVKDGELDGLLTSWYENGKMKIKGTLKDDEFISSKCWDEDGKEMDCPSLRYRR